MPGTQGLERVSSTPMQANFRRRVAALASSIVLFAVTAPGPAIGPRRVSSRFQGVQPEPYRSRGGRRLGRPHANRRCLRDAVRLMAAFHACLRAGGDQEACDPTGLACDGYREADNGIPRAKLEGWNPSRTRNRAAPVLVSTEAELRKAWADPLQTSIQLSADIFMRSCKTGGPIRESLGRSCSTATGTPFGRHVSRSAFRQDATGFLVVKNITLTRGGNEVRERR